MTGLIDTHCHLQDPRFDTAATDAAIERALAAGVEMVLCGYDRPTNADALRIAERWSGVYPSVGFHPHEAKSVTPADLAELESLASLAEVVAVGEIGLDFYRDLSPRNVQRSVLEAQLEIAVRVRKPVSVHTRGAEEAALQPLTSYSKRRGWHRGDEPVGVMHCFGGTLAQAEKYVEIGFVVSVACTITYPANHELRHIAAALPLEALIVETDSPYLPPQFMRGGRNEPVHVVSAAQGIAAARGITLADVTEATSKTSRKVFGLGVPAVSRW